MAILKSISVLLSAIIVFAGNFFPSQKNIVNYLGSIEEIADNVFAVDYTLDYDSDKMMKNGVNTNVEAVDWDGYICYTLWSCVYNNSKGTLTICTNRNYDKPIKVSVTDWL